MKILLTGASGNIGSSTLLELMRRGYTVRCLLRPHAANKKLARQLAGRVEIAWGDLRHKQEVAAAVEGQEAIIHLAYILPPFIDDDHKLAHEVNINGMKYLLEAAHQQAQAPSFLFSSTLDVFGHTQHLPPPRRITDPIQATDLYSQQKIECEQMLQDSGLTWAIYRFADVPPLKARQPHPIMFRIPLDTRLEMLHTYDAGLAIANGIESKQIWRKILLVGGGEHCQVTYRDYLNASLNALGIGSLPEEAFSNEPYCTDWLDTEESQALLNYQNNTFESIMQSTAQAAGPARWIIPLIRPLIRNSLLKMSPHLQKSATV